ncbi:ABC transporter permease [Brevibacillus dissolubilis]|uniref:ABC transporter permease n=1 Tax=Brevibacillus dissolubilis TaxID=1844116 RepID=UPI00111678DE|nr:ABC-2 family transporter protein [Brevibacillus dissolubilis]
MFRKYMVLLRMKYVEMFAYQLATIVWVVGAMIQPLITMIVWMNIYPQESDSFVLYFTLLILVERMTSAWDVWELDREIREGTFSYHIVRPMHPIHWAIAENIIYKGLFLAVLLPIWIIVAFFVPALQPHMDWAQWGMFVVAILLGAAIRFLFSYTCGLLGFWVTKVSAIYGVFEAVSLFFSGRIAPLSLLPPVMQEISLYLPFRYMIGFPVEIATGAVTGEAVGFGFLGSAVWVSLLLMVLGLLWRAGLKKNQAVGG